MTRINLIPPSELCDQHLLAEWREMTRIPNSILSDKLSYTDIPKKYTIRTADNPLGGKGHVKFFADKLKWLNARYYALIIECGYRGFNVSCFWPVHYDHNFKQLGLWNDYRPTPEAIALNRTRIIERTPKNPRYTEPKIQRYKK